MNQITMSKAERDTRIQLAACYRIFDYLGWSELIFNHITAKIADTDGHFLINPYGLHYSEVTASNLVKVDIDGNLVETSQYKPNPAGMVIHSAIHAARPELHFISHLHTTESMAVACQQEGLRGDNFYSVLLHNQVAYHDFQGLTVDPTEKQQLVENLGDKKQLILRNHGILSAGTTIEDMFINTWILQRSCEIQVATDSTGRANTPISIDIAEKSAQLIKIQQGGEGNGVLEFNAMVRLISKKDDSYRDV